LVIGARVPLPPPSLFSAKFPPSVGPSQFLSHQPGLTCLLALSSLERGASDHEPKDSCGEASNGRPISRTQGLVLGPPPRSTPGLCPVFARPSAGQRGFSLVQVSTPLGQASSKCRCFLSPSLFPSVQSSSASLLSISFVSAESGGRGSVAAMPFLYRRTTEGTSRPAPAAQPGVSVSSILCGCWIISSVLIRGVCCCCG
jgi:hypothetical protein